MGKEVLSENISLPALYKYALTHALQTNFIVPDAVIDRLHRNILKELKLKGKDLVKIGLLSSEDISQKLDYQVQHILVEARKSNNKRRFSFNAKKIKGLFHGLPGPVYEHTVLSGLDNVQQLDDIKSWLCDMNGFSRAIGGYWSEAGTSFDAIRDDLKIEDVLPRILTASSVVRSKSMNSVNVDFTTDVFLRKIELQLLAHDPSNVDCVGEVERDSWTLSCSITKAKGIQVESSGNTIFHFPLCKVQDVEAVLESNVVFSVRKKLEVKFWAVFITAGFTSLFNTKTSQTFSHSLTLKVRIPSNNIKLREAVRVNISEDEAKTFINHYNELKKMMATLTGNKDMNTQPDYLVPDASFIYLRERYPWLEFIETLRRGGVDASMELLKKKPEVLRNLPKDETNALGVAFEEIQIAKIMAESIRNNVDLKLIAGDGRGRFRYNDVDMQTPEYTDAVFRKTTTKGILIKSKVYEYFAVQFMYTDKAVYLEQMIQHWNDTWQDRPFDPNSPEALKLENVKLIGPKDIVANMEVENIGHEIRKRFKQDKRIGFKHSSDDTETLKKFLDDNTELLQEMVNSDNYTTQQKLKKDVRKAKNDIKLFDEKLNKLRNVVDDLRTRREEALQKGKSTNGYDKGIAKNNETIQTSRDKMANSQKMLADAEGEMEVIEMTIRNELNERLNNSYRKNYAHKAALKEGVLNTVVSAAVDGITTFIYTCGDEYQKYIKGEITLSRLAGVVAKETIIATARGGAYGLGFTALSMLANYATVNGSVMAGALTIGSKIAGPAFMAAMFMKQSHDILKAWNDGDITTAEMEKSFGRSITTGALSLAGTIACGSLIGGPVGMVVGAGLAIIVGVLDYFLGDKFWSLFFTEDSEEAHHLLEKKVKELKHHVLDAAYDLLDLTEYATKEEVREKYKVAILKYHPDKGGNADIFHAVHAAYKFICHERQFDTDN